MTDTPVQSGIRAGAPRLVETVVPADGDSRRRVEIAGQRFVIEPGVVRCLRLDDEWYEDVKDPEAVVGMARKMLDGQADLFSFWQRLPDARPRYAYYREWEPVAALRVESYEHWWKNQVISSVRGRIRKAAKSGLIVREASYDDDFIRGMVEIFNETPVRQNRRFPHYGKDFDTVKREFSRYLFRERLLGAYCADQLIGFVMLADAGEYAALAQIISRVSHRDKAPNNALLAKAVEVCDARGIAHLVYGYWTDDGLSDFKKKSGFERVDLPRYFVPLTRKGELALRLGLHRGWKHALPAWMVGRLKRLRARWYERALPGPGARGRERLPE